MKKLIIMTLILTVSCSSTKELKQITGVQRSQIDQVEYKRPEFYIMNYKKKASRKIASISEEESTNYSNRQLYFLSSYQQYRDLSKALGISGEVNFCPSFHDLVLQEKKNLDTYTDLDYKNINFSMVEEDESNIAYFPILSTPYGRGDLYSQLADKKWKNTKEYTEQALTSMHSTMKKNLSILCDRGINDGYYVFDNLVNYFKGNKSFHETSSGIKALVKVPVIANMLILDNLKTSSFSLDSQNKFSNIMLKRANITWFKNYLDQINEGRNKNVSLYKNK